MVSSCEGLGVQCGSAELGSQSQGPGSMPLQASVTSPERKPAVFWELTVPVFGVLDARRLPFREGDENSGLWRHENGC